MQYGIFHIINRVVTKQPQYKECVVVAENEKDAKIVAVEKLCKFDEDKWPISIDKVTCYQIGWTTDLKKRIVCIQS